jgi:hypothetical protein
VKATAHLDQRRRVLTVLEAKRAELQRPLSDLQETLGIEASATETLVAAVVNEQIASLLGELKDRETAVAKVMASVECLKAVIRERRWLPLIERINIALNTRQLARWEQQEAVDWRS